jgi:hypothetical protein
MMRKVAKYIIFFVIALGLVREAKAEDKTWKAQAGWWEEADNWFPEIVPTKDDDVVVDGESADVTIQSDFEIQSLTLGGSYSSQVTINDFVFGEIAPSSSSNPSIFNRKDGYLILKGAGIVKATGAYKSSEEKLAEEPSFIFWIE